MRGRVGIGQTPTESDGFGGRGQRPGPVPYRGLEDGDVAQRRSEAGGELGRVGIGQTPTEGDGFGGRGQRSGPVPDLGLTVGEVV